MPSSATNQPLLFRDDAHSRHAREPLHVTVTVERRGQARNDGSPRILVVVTNADLAGAPSHVRDLVLSLRRRFSIVVAFGEQGPIKDLLALEGIETHLLPRLASRISPLADLQTIVSLVALIRSTRAELVHAHSTKAGMVARLAGVLARVPVLFTIHGWGFGIGRPRRQSRFVWLTERVLAPIGSRYVTVSQADADVARDAFGLQPPRMVVIHNGVVDDPKRADPASAQGIAMVARVDYSKDYETALSAFSQLRADATFTCIGAGTDQEDFIRAGERWAGEARSRVRFAGVTTDVAGHLAAAAVFVLVSRYEGLPLSIIEAMRAGLPVVATDAGGVRELIAHEETGLLVPIGAVEALRDALQRLVDDPGLRARLGRAARVRYEREFTIGPMCDKIAELYWQMLAERPRGVWSRRSPVGIGSAQTGRPLA